MELQDVTSASGQIERAFTISSSLFPGAATLSRAELASLAEYAESIVTAGPDAVKTAIVRDMSKLATGSMAQRAATALGAKSGDVVVAAVGSDYTAVSTHLGKLRTFAAGLVEKHGVALRRPDEYRFLWVQDFPLFEQSAELGRLAACHHPFTAPLPEDEHLLKTDPMKARYLLMINLRKKSK
jgi:aspartyl-tRNA synthetase